MAGKQLIFRLTVFHCLPELLLLLFQSYLHSNINYKVLSLMKHLLLRCASAARVLEKNCQRSTVINKRTFIFTFCCCGEEFQFLLSSTSFLERIISVIIIVLDVILHPLEGLATANLVQIFCDKVSNIIIKVYC